MRVVGVSSGASAPEELVDNLVEFFRARGTTDISRVRGPARGRALHAAEADPAGHDRCRRGIALRKLLGALLVLASTAALVLPSSRCGPRSRTRCTATSARCRSQLRDLGVWGAIVLVALILIHAVVFFPAEIANATAGLVFGFWVALPRAGRVARVRGRPRVVACVRSGGRSRGALRGRGAARKRRRRVSGPSAAAARAASRGSCRSCPSASSATSPARRACRSGATRGRARSACCRSPRPPLPRARARFAVRLGSAAVARGRDDGRLALLTVRWRAADGAAAHRPASGAASSASGAAGRSAPNASRPRRRRSRHRPP